MPVLANLLQRLLPSPSSPTPATPPSFALPPHFFEYWEECGADAETDVQDRSPHLRHHFESMRKSPPSLFFFISAKCAPWRDFTVSDIAKEFLVGKLLAKRLHGKVGMMQVTCSLGRALGLCRCCAVVLTCGLLPSFNMEVWCTTNTRARLQQNVGQSACAHSRYPTEGRSDTCTTETGVGGSVGDNGRR